MLEIEQWDLEIKHVKGIDNTLADILSRNPPHVNEHATESLRQRDQIMVHAIDLNIDNSIKKELKNLAILQDIDPRLKAIKEGVTTRPTTATKYTINDDVLYCKRD
jgi:hypothetical protein